MFPFLSINVTSELPSHPDSSKPSSRLDIHRQHLEHKKMYHLNTMAVEQSFSNLDRQLETRRQVLLATEGRTTITHRVRRNLAMFLISAGQRIRPEAPLGEPRYHG